VQGGCLQAYEGQVRIARSGTRVKMRLVKKEGIEERQVYGNTENDGHERKSGNQDGRRRHRISKVLTRNGGRKNLRRIDKAVVSEGHGRASKRSEQEEKNKNQQDTANGSGRAITPISHLLPEDTRAKKLHLEGKEEKDCA